MRFKQHIPWQIKIAAKIALARLPVGYRFWQSLGLFKHGAMERPEYAFEVFCTHYSRVPSGKIGGSGFVALELGSGDSLFSALIAKALGATKIYLVDVGPFASRNLASYQEMAGFLRSRGFNDFRNYRTIDAILLACSADYLTEGLNSLRTIPSRSVDFIWSHSVLQHIRHDEFLATLRELRRIQRREGVGSHRVDLKDHLGGALNNLRFEARTWESDFWARSGFYTNRIRYSEMLELFQQVGFDTEVLEVRRWTQLPTPREKFVAPFQDLPDEELVISGFDVLLQ